MSYLFAPDSEVRHPSACSRQCSTYPYVSDITLAFILHDHNVFSVHSDPASIDPVTAGALTTGSKPGSTSFHLNQDASTSTITATSTLVCSYSNNGHIHPIVQTARHVTSASLRGERNLRVCTRRKWSRQPARQKSVPTRTYLFAGFRLEIRSQALT